MHRTGLIVIVLCLYGTAAAAADYYRYVDENGVVRFTDDANQVPDPQRDSVQKYQEIPLSASPPTEVTSSQSSLPGEPESPQSVAGEEPAGRDVSANAAMKPSTNFDQMRAELVKQKKLLDDEHRALTKDLEGLQAEKEAANTKRLIKAYNERALALNRRIEIYEKKLQALNEKVTAYNAMVGGPEKKAQ